MRKNPDRRHEKKQKRTEPKQVQKPQATSLQHFGKKYRALILGAGTLAAGITGGALLHNRMSGEHEAPSAPSHSVKLSSELFTPRPVEPNISRTDIPRILSERLKDLVSVFEAPEYYDPEKPNLYLIGDTHVRGEGHERIKGYETQELIMRIFHELAALGCQTLFLEGVTQGFLLEHDKQYDNLGEYPSRDFSPYVTSGRINRAYVAVEGIYKDQVKCIGAEEDILQALHMKNAFEAADSQDFPVAMRDIFLALSQELGVSFDSSRIEDPRYVQSFSDAVRSKLEGISGFRREDLVKRVVLGNPQYVRYLDAATTWFVHRLPGRNASYAQFIQGSLRTFQDDAAFFVGAEHLTHLRSLISGVNVFLVVPRTIPKEILSKFFYFFGETDYRANLLANDLYLFGLGQKPEHSLFDDPWEE